MLDPRRSLRASLILSALVVLVLALTGAVAAASPGEPVTLPELLSSIP